jgi:hypothetical protein
LLIISTIESLIESLHGCIYFASILSAFHFKRGLCLTIDAN